MNGWNDMQAPGVVRARASGWSGSWAGAGVLGVLGVLAQAGCSGGDGVASVDPVGVWTAVHVQLVATSTPTQSITLPYTDPNGEQTSTTLTFRDDSTVVIDDSGYVTDGTWAILAPRKFDITADIDWDELVCTIWANDDDAMLCVFSDPTANLNVDLVR